MQTRAIFWNTAAQVTSKLMGAVLAIIGLKILSVYLGPGLYGSYGTVVEYLAFFAIVADFGLYTYALKEMGGKERKEQEDFYQHVLWARTILSISLMILALIGAQGLALISQTYANPLVQWGILISTIMVVFSMMSGTLSLVLQIQYRMQIVAIAQVIGKVLSTLGVVLVAYWLYPESGEEGFLTLFLFGILGAVAGYALIWRGATKNFKVRWGKPNWGAIRNLLWASAPFALMVALMEIYLRIDIILLGVLLPSVEASQACLETYCAQTEVGKYLVAARLMEVLLIIPVFFMNAVLPGLTAAESKKDPERFQSIMNGAWKVLLILGCGGMIMLVPYGRDLTALISDMSFVSDGEGNGSDTALFYLGLMLPLSYISFGANFCLIALGKQRQLAGYALIAVSVNILGNLWAIPQMGLMGAALTSLLSEVVFLSLKLWGISRWKPELLRKLPSLMGQIGLVAGVITVGALFLHTEGVLPVASYLSLAMGGGVLYLGALWAVGALKWKEVRGVI